MRAAHSTMELAKALGVIAAVIFMFVVVIHGITGML
jgi:hypothetical protein